MKSKLLNTFKRTFFIILLFVFLDSINLYSAEPIVKLEPFPGRQQLEPYEDNEDLFAMMLLDYFQTAVILQSQLLHWNIEPEIRVSAPMLEDISSLEISVLKKYHSLAARLLKQIEALPDEKLQANLRNLQETVRKEKEKNMDLVIRNFELEMQANKAEIYEQRALEIMRMSDSLKVSLDSISYNYYMLKMSDKSALTRAFKDSYYPTFSVSNAGIKLFTGSDAIENDLAFQVEALLNLNQATQYGKYFDIWAYYTFPRFKTKSTDVAGNDIETQWQSHIWGFGVNFNFPDMIQFDNVRTGAKFGLGHFRGGLSASNSIFPSSDFNGEQLNFEVNFSNFTISNPLTLYFNFNALFVSNDMRFETQTPIVLSKPNMFAIGFGLRYNLF